MGSPSPNIVMIPVTTGIAPRRPVAICNPRLFMFSLRCPAPLRVATSEGSVFRQSELSAEPVSFRSRTVAGEKNRDRGPHMFAYLGFGHMLSRLCPSSPAHDVEEARLPGSSQN